MKIFFAIVRWFFALGIGLVMYLAVVIAVPVSIFGSQLLDSTSGTRWFNALTADEKSMETFTDALYKGVGDAENGDATFQHIFNEIGNESTALGTSIRQVFPSTIITKNIKDNSSAFYDWLDGKKDVLSLKFYVGGTAQQQSDFVGNFLETRYEALPACTEEQAAAVTSDSLIGAECSTGAVSSAVFKAQAAEILSDPEIKPYLNEGIPWNVDATESDRQIVLNLQKTSKFGVTLAWGILALSVLFMLILFTPWGVSFFVTGMIVGFTGLTILGMGGGIKSFAAQENGSPASTETISRAFGDTLGKPIAQQGLSMLLLSMFLMAVGLFILFKKQKKNNVKVMATERVQTQIAEPKSVTSNQQATEIVAVSTVQKPDSASEKREVSEKVIETKQSDTK